MIGLVQDRPLSIWWTLHFQPCFEKRKKSLNYRKSKKTKSDFVEKRFESDQMLELISKFIHLSLSQNNLSAVRSVVGQNFRTKISDFISLERLGSVSYTTVVAQIVVLPIF